VRWRGDRGKRSGRGKEEGAGGDGCLGRQEEAEGEVLGFDGLQLLFIRRKRDLSHPFDDERCKMIGLFGPNGLVTIFLPCLTFFFFFFISFQYENN
jgi:hypothetical protein